MLLSADILFDNLPESFHARMVGPHSLTLDLQRPVLCEGDEKSFLSNHLYFAHADRLPARIHAEKDAVVVCVGNSAHLAHYQQRCCVISLPREIDFFHAFNVLQGIFDTFDTWESDLASILEQDSDITRMLTRSEKLFGNALYAIDEDFHILGASPLAAELQENSAFTSEDGTSLRLGSFDQFLELHDLSMDEREPMLISLLDQSTLNYNLHENEQYRGCLTLHYKQRPYRASDKPLLAFLGEMVLRAALQLSSKNVGEHHSIAQALQGLVEGIPLDSTSQQLLEKATSDGNFICMRLKLSNKLEQIPLGYLRNTLESTFSKSSVFEYHHNSIVAVIDLNNLDAENYLENICESIQPFTGTMGMKAGLSDTYNNLLYTHHMFLQANIALDNGVLFSPHENIFHFHDFALREIIMNATNELPLDLLMPSGLHKLIEHDQASDTSYIETLRTYLNNNTSIAKTAAQLYVHRSTLMERLNRIKRELGLDLDSPDTRLHLQIILKALELHDSLTAQSAE
ncbi:MAG: helix-turn-helix domain-containing protein [Eggerthellaceae bacterium]|nr:helix-turn-helix domain-containing protein [Eggerthellaceae bacterium]